MVYDNTKLNIAVGNWLAGSCSVGFGEESAADLLASFIDHCTRTGEMKRSPGRVVFGRVLAEQNFDKRQVAGITHWAGLALRKRPKTVVQTQYKKTEKALEKRKIETKETKKQSKKQKIRSKKQNISAVKKRMARENASSTRAVGGDA